MGQQQRRLRINAMLLLETGKERLTNRIVKKTWNVKSRETNVRMPRQQQRRLRINAMLLEKGKERLNNWRVKKTRNVKSRKTNALMSSTLVPNSVGFPMPN